MRIHNVIAGLLLAFGAPLHASQADDAGKQWIGVGASMAVLGMTKSAEKCMEMVFLADAARERRAAGDSLDDLLKRAGGEKDADKAITVGYAAATIRSNEVRQMHSTCIQEAGNMLLKK